MAHALVVDNRIEMVGSLPNYGKRLDDGELVFGVPWTSADVRAACGWYPVVETDRPEDTDDGTYDYTVELVGDPAQPTVVWVAREWTVDELAARTAVANSEIIRQRAVDALDVNRTFLALASPTQAAVLAQVKALTNQNVRLIRLALNQLDEVD